MPKPHLQHVLVVRVARLLIALTVTASFSSCRPTQNQAHPVAPPAQSVIREPAPASGISIDIRKVDPKTDAISVVIANSRAHDISVSRFQLFSAVLNSLRTDGDRVLVFVRNDDGTTLIDPGPLSTDLAEVPAGGESAFEIEVHASAWGLNPAVRLPTGASLEMNLWVLNDQAGHGDVPVSWRGTLRAN